MGSQKSALVRFFVVINKFMINNKYSTVYNSIIDRAKNRVLTGYSETHTALPQLLNVATELEGDNSYTVKLTPKENFICHLCLLKMAESHELEQIELNFSNLVSNRRRKNVMTSRDYEIERSQIVQNKNNINSNVNLTNINNYV